MTPTTTERRRQNPYRLLQQVPGVPVIVLPVNARQTTWSTSLFPKDGRYLLPLKDAVRKQVQVEVDEAGSADEALRQAALNKPDLVLTDIGMKEVNGIELTRQRVKTNEPTAELAKKMYDFSLLEEVQKGK